MRYEMNGLIAAMEEIDNKPVAVDADEAVELVETVADDSAVVQADADEVGISVSQVEDAVQAGEELEDIAEVASEAVESGEGLDETAAEVASIAIESIRNRLGIRGESRLVPATESFGNVNTRVMSTRLIVEGIGDTLKRIWAAIKAAAARIWEKIKSFFVGLFNSASGLVKLISSLRDRARKLPTDAKIKDKKIKHSGIARSISLKGKANLGTYQEIAKNTVNLAGVSVAFGKIGRSVIQAAENLASSDINEANVKAYLQSTSSAAAEADRVMAGAFTVADAYLTGIGATKAKGPKASKAKNVTTKHFGPFVNNSMLTLELVSSAGGSNTWTISFSAPKDKVAEEVDALEPNEIVQVLEVSLKLAAALQDYKKTQGDMDAITKSIQKVSETVIKSAESILNKTGSSTETRLGLAELKDSVNSTLQTLNTFSGRAPSLQFALAKAGADYASVALRNIGEKAFGGK